MNLFGKKKQGGGSASASSDPTVAIMKCRSQIETLEKREAHLQKKIRAHLLEAKAKSQAKDKNGALFALKRKKMCEGEITKINGARMTLETQALALEASNTNLETFKAMQSAALSMKEQRGRLDVDDVDRVMDDIQEEMDIADQIGEAIARPAEGIFDDDDLMAELNQLEEADLEEQMLSAPPIPQKGAATPAAVPTMRVPQQPVQHFDLPSVPTGVPLSMPPAPVTSAEEDEELAALRELERSMAL